jgi:hypothetical protein
MSEEELTTHDKAIVKATIKEFMDQIYSGIGRGVIERLFWIAVGALIWVYFGGKFFK